MELKYVACPLGQDLIDSRDMLARKEYLELFRESLKRKCHEELDDDEENELCWYEEVMLEVGKEYFDMGVTFIKDTYFSQAMRDDFLEFNQIDEALECYIDFDSWETVCSMDHTDIEIGGCTYSFRTSFPLIDAYRG
tara:strand:- start:96 stop:506 length:411 start_codon:yes stop_codon:yes gene_type:complete